ncbi:MAG: hypothetical protein HZA46_12880 [Planctomycetales bacterium]|nr:hypothetical protein [Planctomycetales bacterium]
MNFTETLRARIVTSGSLLLLGMALLQPAIAVEPREPGLNELVIYDPGVHERGLPAVNFVPSEDGMKVDIPPIVHVHRFYYSGNKEYQGPLIAGGPTIVVANHPKTGERMYIDVMLPPGAPIIEYDDHSITYAFPDRRVHLCFSSCENEKVTVTYLSGKGIVRKLKEHRDQHNEKVKAARERSPLTKAVKDIAADGRKVAKGAVTVAGGAIIATVETTTKVVRVVPGVQFLQSLSDQSTERQELESVRQAGNRMRAEEIQTVRTVR